MRTLLPLFLDLIGRDVLLVGAGRVAAGKLRQLRAAGANVRVVSPSVLPEIASTSGIDLLRRRFEPTDLDGVWLVVAAAPPAVNKQVAEAAEERRVFVNAVDDPRNASAFLSGVVRRDDVTIAISTAGDAPALTALVREALDRVLPGDLGAWIALARERRSAWRHDGVPMDARKPLLLQALIDLYRRPEGLRHNAVADRFSPAETREGVAQGFSPAEPSEDVAQGFSPAEPSEDVAQGFSPAKPL